jgi:FKBP-type peptidyl-prolyl cis-trans isomerase
MIFSKPLNSSIFILTLFVVGSCKENKPETVIPEPTVQDLSMEESIKLSQNWNKDESYQIDQFIERNQWQATTSGTGVRYFIYEEGSGKQAEKGKVALVDYEVRLLDANNTLCYTSDSTGSIDFLIEMDNIESGLHEAITYLKEGDKAHIILPHYLAHGLGGDMDKIPPLSPVWYNIHLLKVVDLKDDK